MRLDDAATAYAKQRAVIFFLVIFNFLIIFFKLILLRYLLTIQRIIVCCMINDC